MQLALKGQSTNSTSTQVRIQGSDVDVVDKNNNVTDLPGASNAPDISCYESDVDHDDEMKDPDYEPERDADDASSNEQDSFDGPDLRVDHVETVEIDQSGDNVTLNRSKRNNDSSSWKKNNAKRLRMEGKAYKGMKKVDGKWDFHVDRSGRILTPKNCSKRCDRSGVKNCNNIAEDDRKVIFNRFWSMNWDQKKIYVNSLVEIQSVKEKTTNTEISRRSRSYKYFLRRNNERLCVCKGLFLSTLGIGEKTVYAWVDNSASGIPEKKQDSGKHN